MSMININDLFNEKNEREKHKNKIYDDVLKQCHRKIIRSVKIDPYSRFCFYIIPKFIYGVPLYNIEKCIHYLVVHLTKNGFKINYTHPNLLIISWENKETKKNEPLMNTPFKSESNVRSTLDYKPSNNLIYNSNQLTELNRKTNYLLK